MKIIQTTQSNFGEPWLGFNVKLMNACIQRDLSVFCSHPPIPLAHASRISRFTDPLSYWVCVRVHVCAGLRTIKRISTFLKRNSCGSRSRVRLVFLESRPSAPWKRGVGHNTCLLRTDTRLSKHRVSDRTRPSRLPCNDKTVGKLLNAAAPVCPFSSSMNVAYEMLVFSLILVDNERVICVCWRSKGFNAYISWCNRFGLC